jgi:hypothetical protein
MDDILEKTTINIDSDYANFTSDTEFYVDIIDDIKNCIYIKTLKTEVFVKANYPEQYLSDDGGNATASDSSYVEDSIFNNKTNTEGNPAIIKRNVFNLGDYLYVTLNDIYRINTVSKKTTVKTFSDIQSNENDNDFGLVWTKVDKTPNDYNSSDQNNLYIDANSNSGIESLAPYISFNNQLKSYAKIKDDGSEAGNTEDLNDKIIMTKQELIDIFGNNYKNIFNQNTYYQETDLYSITYRYVPTYIGYTKDSQRINKYTWEVLNTIDAEKADRLKYVYNSEGPLLSPTNRVYNYQIQKEEMNTLKYYDCIYINKPTIHTNLLSDPICYLLSYKQELSGTSCGPNDTNTMVLNPILPELKRFNIKIWRINELGEHVEIPITKNGVFRVIMSFTVYYKRKKVTRV